MFTTKRSKGERRKEKRVNSLPGKKSPQFSLLCSPFDLLRREYGATVNDVE
jgi:hypothetical protein